MNEFINLLSTLEFPNSVCKCASGEITNPILDFSAPFEWYGFPPALIPVWSEGSGPNYYGYWKHWFSDRKPSFVHMNVSAGREVKEIARTADQFLCCMVIAAICLYDGIELSTEQFANKIKLSNLSEIDDVTLDTGDNPKGFVKLPQFTNLVPLASIKDDIQYSGDFPTVKTLNSTSLISSFELPLEIIGKFRTEDRPMPDWLDASKVKNSFNENLKAGDFSKAWLSLNSTGWSIAEAKLALKELNNSVNDQNFNTLATWWLSIADESVGGY